VDARCYNEVVQFCTEVVQFCTEVVQCCTIVVNYYMEVVTS
jgi:hypothetical protein